MAKHGIESYHQIVGGGGAARLAHGSSFITAQRVTDSNRTL